MSCFIACTTDAADANHSAATSRAPLPSFHPRHHRRSRLGCVAPPPPSRDRLSRRRTSARLRCAVSTPSQLLTTTKTRLRRLTPPAVHSHNQRRAQHCHIALPPALPSIHVSYADHDAATSCSASPPRPYPPPTPTAARSCRVTRPPSIPTTDTDDERAASRHRRGGRLWNVPRISMDPGARDAGLHPVRARVRLDAFRAGGDFRCRARMRARQQK